MGNTQSSWRRVGAGISNATTPTPSHDQSGSSSPDQVQNLATSRPRVGRSRSTSGRHRFSFYNTLRQRQSNSRESVLDNDANDNPTDTLHSDNASNILVDNTLPDLTDSSPHTTLHRSQSTMSRLGSRLLPDPVVRGLLSSGEETQEEGEALRRGVSARRRPSVFERRAPSVSDSRFQFGGTLRRRLEARSESRRSIRSDHQRLQNGPDSLEDGSGDTSMTDGDVDVYSPNRRARFSRMRQSVLLPLSGMFGSVHGQRRLVTPRPSTPHPRQTIVNGALNQFLDSTQNQDAQLDSGHAIHELDAVESESRNILSPSRIASGMTSIRRFPHGLRSRSTRLIRRGEHPPLSQVLQLAAAAIAAQLSGHALPGGDATRPIGSEAFDGSIQSFVQTLQDAASAQAGANIDMNAVDGDLPPVNFMRVFQFPNDENGTPIASAQGRELDRMDVDPAGVGTDGDRSVTLVLVGVRSMPNIQDGSAGENGGIGPSLDTLLSLPAFLPPANVLRNGSSGALFRRSDTRTRNSRRHSMTNFNFPAQYESQRHHRTRTNAQRDSLEQPLLQTTRNSIIGTSESPPGPNPPPSTPADIRSGYATPVRRPSSASTAAIPATANTAETDTQANQPSTDEPRPTAAQRRRSDSEFARRPELSSGAARRNGVVEPDRPQGVGRSWLIYVVGTNVSPDHPAFTMPSLFTDNPSYEDMQMLSTLLGPAKPPVATQDEVNSAGGTYRVEVQDRTLVAVPLNRNDPHALTLGPGERCLICLCDYEAAEEIRQLTSCRHVYHRECIDEVAIAVQCVEDEALMNLECLQVPPHRDPERATYSVVAQSLAGKRISLVCWNVFVTELNERGVRATTWSHARKWDGGNMSNQPGRKGMTTVTILDAWDGINGLGKDGIMYTWNQTGDGRHIDSEHCIGNLSAFDKVNKLSLFSTSAVGLL